MAIPLPVPMEEYGAHFNEPLSRPPKLNWNLKTDRRSGVWTLPPLTLAKKIKAKEEARRFGLN